jgi:hypothetical protein
MNIDFNLVLTIATGVATGILIAGLIKHIFQAGNAMIIGDTDKASLRRFRKMQADEVAKS